MTVGLLLITHNELGAVLLRTATRMLGGSPLQAETLAVSDSAERDALIAQARRAAARLDTGEGVLVLTDLYGSTPANIARSLQAEAEVRVINGVNLPMLVRVLNYPALGLADMAAKALSGGRDGVMACPAPPAEREP